MSARDLAQRRVRAGLSEGQAAPQTFVGHRPPRGKPVAELPDERTLPDAGLADDGDEGSVAAVDYMQVRVLKPRELVLPPDEAGCALLEIQRSNAEQWATSDSLRLTLRLDRRLGPEVEGLARIRNAARADQNLSRPRALLEPRRDVDRVTADERAARPRLPQDDVTRVHTDPQAQRVAEEILEPAAHREGGVQGTIDLILLRCRRTEDCDHRVADELLDRSSRLGDLGRHPIVETV